MSLTPNDIIEREFNLKLRGYDRNEVDDFLEECAGAMAAVIRERNNLKDQNVAYNNKIADLIEKQNSVTEAITSVHKMAEDMKTRAAKDAELIVKKARMEADRIVADAHKEALNLEERVMKLRRMQREAIIKIRTMIQGYLDLLNDAELNMPPEHISTTMSAAAAEMREINQGADHTEILNDSSKEATCEGAELSLQPDGSVDNPVSMEEKSRAEIKEDQYVDNDLPDSDLNEEKVEEGAFSDFKPEKLIP